MPNEGDVDSWPTLFFFLYTHFLLLFNLYIYHRLVYRTIFHISIRCILFFMYLLSPTCSPIYEIVQLPLGNLITYLFSDHGKKGDDIVDNSCKMGFLEIRLDVGTYEHIDMFDRMLRPVSGSLFPGSGARSNQFFWWKIFSLASLVYHGGYFVLVKCLCSDENLCPLPPVGEFGRLDLLMSLF